MKKLCVVMWNPPVEHTDGKFSYCFFKGKDLKDRPLDMGPSCWTNEIQESGKWTVGRARWIKSQVSFGDDFIRIASLDEVSILLAMND
jgi:hypothetical protein